MKGAVRLTLFYFFLIACLGAFLRYFFISPNTYVNFRFLVHTHSHVALLGWGFNAMFILVSIYFDHWNSKIKIIFWLLQVCVAGMLFTFPFQGYAGFSITFSTLHILITYYYSWLIIKERDITITYSGRFLKLGLLYFVLSTLGPFLLAIFMVKGMRDTYWYDLSIYFYLHFQYNGWFVLVIMALLLQSVELSGICLPEKKVKTVFYLVGLTVLPEFILSVLWLDPGVVWHQVNGIISIVQVVGILLFINVLYKPIMVIKPSFKRNLLWILVVVLLLKSIGEFVPSFSAVARFVFNQRGFPMAYLHLIFIGFLSIGIIFFFIQSKILRINWILKGGIVVLFTGFIISEMLLVFQPMVVPLGLHLPMNIDEGLFYSSVLMPIGALLIFINSFQAKGNI